MAVPLVTELPTGGFSFVNTLRNASLEEHGFVPPKTTKTGTTIVGVIYNNGVALGADTRATSDSIVADKNCKKIHMIAPRIRCAGAGTAADTFQVTKNISSQLELMRLNTGREVPVVAANRLLKQHLFRYQGHVSAALVLGGVDNDGPKIYCIYPHGSTDLLPYATMGSGSLAAMSVIESQWKPDMTEQEAILVVRNAIYAGITNDLGSGSNVDVTVIRQKIEGNQEFVETFRNYEIVGKTEPRAGDYSFRHGATEVLKTEVILLGDDDENRMDIDAEGAGGSRS